MELKAILAAVNKKIRPETVRTGEKMADGIVDGIDNKQGLFTRAFRKIGRELGNEGENWVKKLKAPFERMAKGNFILTRLFGQTILGIGRATAALVAFSKATGRVAFSLLHLADTAIEF